MNKLLEDLSVITTITQNALNNLVARSLTCIGHAVHESVLERESMTKIDIGVGILYITYEGSEVKYKFIPSKKLEESVNQVLISKKSPLTANVETTLKDRIEHTYKNLL